MRGIAPYYRRDAPKSLGVAQVELFGELCDQVERLLHVGPLPDEALLACTSFNDRRSQRRQPPDDPVDAASRVVAVRHEIRTRARNQALAVLLSLAEQGENAIYKSRAGRDVRMP